MRVQSVLFLLCNAASAAILAIDYGTEWTKAALVKPGIPLEIVLTKDTKRKEQSVIAFKGEERLYGQDAANMASRFPAYTFPSLKNLLGAQFESQNVLDFAKLYPASKIVRSDHNTVAFQLDDEVVPVEELVAMELINIRKNAELMADEGIRDVILTVPPHFNQAARIALIESAKLAGLRVIELMSDGLAVAVDYAKGRSFNTSQNHIIFDMGAGGTSATIVQLSTKSVKDVGRFNKTITTLDVLGVGSSSLVGGNIMTSRLYSHLIDEFDKQHGSKTSAPIVSDPRATARLLKEATRIKQVLSANNEAMVSIESLYEDIDFRYKVTRTEFEDLNADLASLSIKPIKSALSMAGVSINDIDSLILHGGAARVPLVQQALLEIIAEDKIARNVNADEAAVMGAVFRGAGLSGSFRVKELILQDICAQSYSYSDETGSHSMFPAGTPLGSSFNITVKQPIDEYKMTIQYDQADETIGAVPVATIKLSGISNTTNALEKEHKCKNSEILAVVQLDHSGIVSVGDAAAVCEVQEKQGVADKVKGWFGGKDSATETKSEDKKETETSMPEQVSKTVIKRAPVSHSMEYLEIQKLPKSAHEQSISRIRKFEKHDTDRVARETARNGLEAYIYKVRDLLESDSFTEVSTDAERSNLKSLAATADEWMYGDGDTAPLADLVAKRRSMSTVVDPIDLRRKELQTRDDKVSALQKQISTARSFAKKQYEKIEEHSTKKLRMDERLMAEMKSKLAIPQGDDAEGEPKADGDKMIFQEEFTFEGLEDLFEPPYTKDDLKALETKVDEVERWLSTTKEEQSALEKYQDPVLLGSDLETKATKLKDELAGMIGRASYKQQAKPKPKSKPKATKKKSGSKTTTTFKASGSTKIPLPDEPSPAPGESPAQQPESVLEQEVAEDDPPAAEPATTPDVKDEL